MVKAAEAISARARARQAKAELDAQRAEQDRLIVDAATEFYEAVEALEAAHAATVTAEEQRTASVTRLAGLGQTDAQIATLCGLSVKEVRELRRRPSAAAAKPTTTAAVEPAASHAPVRTGDASPAAQTTAAA